MAPSLQPTTVFIPPSIGAGAFDLTLPGALFPEDTFDADSSDSTSPARAGGRDDEVLVIPWDSTPVVPPLFRTESATDLWRPRISLPSAAGPDEFRAPSAVVGFGGIIVDGPVAGRHDGVISEPGTGYPPIADPAVGPWANLPMQLAEEDDVAAALRSLEDLTPEGIALMDMAQRREAALRIQRVIDAQAGEQMAFLEGLQEDATAGDDVRAQNDAYAARHQPLWDRIEALIAAFTDGLTGSEYDEMDLYASSAENGYQPLLLITQLIGHSEGDPLSPRSVGRFLRHPLLTQKIAGRAYAVPRPLGEIARIFLSWLLNGADPESAESPQARWDEDALVIAAPNIREMNPDSTLANSFLAKASWPPRPDGHLLGTILRMLQWEMAIDPRPDRVEIWLNFGDTLLLLSPSFAEYPPDALRGASAGRKTHATMALFRGVGEMLGAANDHLAALGGMEWRQARGAHRAFLRRWERTVVRLHRAIDALKEDTDPALARDLEAALMRPVNQVSWELMRVLDVVEQEEGSLDEIQPQPLSADIEIDGRHRVSVPLPQQDIAAALMAWLTEGHEGLSLEGSRLIVRHAAEREASSAAPSSLHSSPWPPDPANVAVATFLRVMGWKIVRMESLADGRIEIEVNLGGE